MSRPLAALCLVLAMGFTGSNVPLGKAIVADIPVYALLLIRFAVATPVLALLAWREPGPRLRDMSLAQWRDVLALSALGSVAYMALSLEGVKLTSGIDAGIILSTLPAVAAVLGMALKRERPGALQTTAVLAAVAGLAVVNAAAAAGSGSSAIGNLLVAVAVLCEAIFVLVAGRISAVYRPFRLALAVSATSLLLSLPLAAGELATLSLPAVPVSAWLAAVWYGLSASIFSTVLWYRGAPHVETWLAGLATAALPVSALVVSVLLLGETADHSRLAGAALVIAAIVLGALAPGRGRARD